MLVDMLSMEACLARAQEIEIGGWRIDPLGAAFVLCLAAFLLPPAIRGAVLGVRAGLEERRGKRDKVEPAGLAALAEVTGTSPLDPAAAAALRASCRKAGMILLLVCAAGVVASGMVSSVPWTKRATCGAIVWLGLRFALALLCVLRLRRSQQSGGSGW